MDLLALLEETLVLQLKAMVDGQFPHACILYLQESLGVVPGNACALISDESEQSHFVPLRIMLMERLQ